MATKASYGSLASNESKSSSDQLPFLQKHEEQSSSSTEGEERRYTFLHIIIYALINVIIAVPGLYGYASVIFNHPCFQQHINALSKLVIFSSFVHQLGMTLFSSLGFAIGTVQDAGLIFLSAMANTIADNILGNGGTIEEVISTTLVILPIGTASLGFVLMLLGKFRLLDIVSYLPMPVIGGYLAFIGYFCLQAGVALCIGKAMTTLSDWSYLLDPHSLLLALPGLLAALVLTIISRKAVNDAILPLAMIIIPALFFVVLSLCSFSLDNARSFGWVGDESPPVPASELIKLVDFKLVHWSLIKKCIGTWVGMVFVVTFASCLDIAAVSMDMGKPLDTNAEMVTVGTSNFMSGLLFGFTGSYIFSQTIFTYRSGCHSRYVGVIIMGAYIFVVLSPINLLSIAPLFFLGATLIFIGYDLCWEWFIDIRGKLLFMEYLVLLTTFVAIQVIGMDFGILFGVIIALIEHVASTTRVSSLQRVLKRSRAIWSDEHYQILQMQGYHPNNQKIVCFQLSGPVFFGSSQKLMQEIMSEIGLSISEQEVKKIALASPHTSTLHSGLRRDKKSMERLPAKASSRTSKPRYVVIDVALMHSLDASACTSCFLQLAKLCEKRGILLFAAGALPRVEWMLRSHDVSLSYDEEVEWKKSMISNDRDQRRNNIGIGKLILFSTLFEALEFSERLLIQSISKGDEHKCLRSDVSKMHSHHGSAHHKLTYIFANILRDEISDYEKSLIDGIQPYYEEVTFRGNEAIFQKDTHPDAFFVVLKGEVAVPRDKIRPDRIVDSAKSLSSSNLLAIGDNSKSIESFHKVGGIFGYCDFLLKRQRTFHAYASGDGAVVAKFTSQSLEVMKNDDNALYVIVQNLLLQASLMDLANCTCHN